MSTTNNTVTSWTNEQKKSFLILMLRIVLLLGLKIRQQDVADFVRKDLGVSTIGPDFKTFKEEYLKHRAVLDSSASNVALRLLRGVAANIEQLKQLWLPEFRSESIAGRADFDAAFKELDPTALAKMPAEIELPEPSSLAPELMALLESIGDSLHTSPTSNPVQPTTARRAPSLTELVVQPPAAADNESSSSAVRVLSKVPEPASGIIRVGLDGTNPAEAPKVSGTGNTLPRITVLPVPKISVSVPPASAPKPVPSKSAMPRVAPAAPPLQQKQKKRSFLLIVLASLLFIFSASMALFLKTKQKPEDPTSDKNTTINTPEGEQGKDKQEPTGEKKDNTPSPAVKVSIPKRPQGLLVDKRNFKAAIADVLSDEWFKETLLRPKDLTWTQAFAFSGDKLPAAWATQAHEQVGAEEDFNSFVAFVCYLGVEVNGEYRPTSKQVWTWMLLRRLAIYRAGEGAPFRDADSFEVDEVKNVREKALIKKGYSLTNNSPSTTESLQSARDKFKQLVAAYRKRALED